VPNTAINPQAQNLESIDQLEGIYRIPSASPFTFLFFLTCHCIANQSYPFEG
jgi:hypothetical protein